MYEVKVRSFKTSVKKNMVVEVLLREYHRETVFTTRSGMKT